MNQLFRVDGKTALVTGARRGIGRAFAASLAHAGADIVAVSRSSSAPETEKLVNDAGRNFTYYSCDFTSRESVYTLIKTLEENNTEIDILVNNAGTIQRRPAAEHPDEYWDEVIAANLSSQFVLTREIAKGMLLRRGGKIIFVASLLSFQGGITVPGYAASKGGIKQLTMALANEWAAKGINVNAIAPGYISTDNTKALREDETRNNAILSRIPQGRWGTPEDLTGALIYLSSPASDYCNGSVITVDGGWMGR
ncbi:MAG: SDR family oxidoreductase [Ignavibacteriaceae bacterium]|nr:SDR family oxidoreductase [Ignavibacteriaceae bacterium]